MENLRKWHLKNSQATGLTTDKRTGGQDGQKLPKGALGFQKFSTAAKKK